MMTDREMLIWIHQRLVKVHGEDPLVDYMHRLRAIIEATPPDRRSIHGTSCDVDSIRPFPPKRSLWWKLFHS